MCRMNKTIRKEFRCFICPGVHHNRYLEKNGFQLIESKLRNNERLHSKSVNRQLSKHNLSLGICNELNIELFIVWNINIMCQVVFSIRMLCK